MKKLSIALGCFVMAFMGIETPIAVSQQSPNQTAAEVGIRSSSEEVLLDVIVRDKKGRPVNDLKAQDFQVFDNGDQKEIKSFRLVQGTESVSQTGARQTLDPQRQIRLVTMIFHCYNNSARGLARSAGFDLLKAELPQNVYLSVMTIDHKLEVLQPFTNDLELLKKAINRATGSQNADFSKDTETVQRQLEDILGPSTNGELTPEGQIANANAAANLSAQQQNPQGSSFANLAMAQIILEMIRTEQSSAMTESGRTEIWSLLDAVKEQYRLPGRKTLIYFSEGGFGVPQGMEQPFKNIISIANRSNVSVYAVDARGLTTYSQNQSAIDTLNRAAQASRTQQENNGSQPVRPEEARLFDTTIESTRANTQNTLANLADSTGGALIANTNDLRAPLRRLAEDIETYYEISYSPNIAHYDGSFHNVSVKVEPSDLRVQSRAGYFALPPDLARTGTTLKSFEVPLLDALNTSEPPSAFPFHVTAMHFRGRENAPMCGLVMDVPFSNITLEKNGEDVYAGRISYVTLLKNAQGEVVKKFGNDIPIDLKSEQLVPFKTNGHFIYTEHFNLTPGHYTLESAILDGAAKRISARKSSLMVPPPTTQLGISSVSIIRNTKESGETPDLSDPFLIGTKVISPTLDPVISKEAAQTVSFYMVIYADPSMADPVHLSMEFSQDGQVLGSGSPPLGSPDKDGRIQYVATAPLAPLNPGEIGIRFIVTQGSEQAVEAVSFTLQ